MSYVWDATHLFYLKNNAEASDYARQLISQLLNKDVNTVIDALRAKAKTEKLNSRAHDTLDKVYNYFTNQAHRMNYKNYLEQGLPIASGVIEGACRHVVKDRMEQSGMRWTMKGAHAMLSLRSVQLSGLWDAFTQKRIERETQLAAKFYSMLAANEDDVNPIPIAGQSHYIKKIF